MKCITHKICKGLFLVGTLNLFCILGVMILMLLIEPHYKASEGIVIWLGITLLMYVLSALILLVYYFKDIFYGICEFMKCN